MSSRKSEKVRVQVTSVDGNVTHPFNGTDTVAEVQVFAYGRIVRDKTQVPMTATSVERALPDGQTLPLSGAELLSSLVGPQEPGHGNEVDLVLSLVWTSQGGTRTPATGPTGTETRLHP